MMSTSPSPSKRARGVDQDETDHEEVERLLLQFDLNKLAVLASQNDRIFQRLTTFSDALQDKLFEVRDKVEASLAEEKRKNLVEKKRGFLESNTCFNCEKRSKVLTPCICFQICGVDGKGKNLCEDCTILKFSTTCSECQMFLCGASCISFSCHGCEEVICKECRGKGECEWKTCKCGTQHCPKLVDNKSAIKQCHDCQEVTGCHYCGDVIACEARRCAGDTKKTAHINDR